MGAHNYSRVYIKSYTIEHAPGLNFQIQTAVLKPVTLALVHVVGENA